jgi:hypothetical protein
MRVYASSAQKSGAKSGPWFFKSNRVSTASSKRPLARTWSGEGHVVIVSSLFLVLFAATLLVGGHAAIDPLLQSALQSAADERDAQSAGDIVYTMPDGVFCRHMSYDNVTGEQTGGSLQRCRTDIVRDSRNYNSHFKWQTN